MFSRYQSLQAHSPDSALQPARVRGEQPLFERIKSCAPSLTRKTIAGTLGSESLQSYSPLPRVLIGTFLLLKFRVFSSDVNLKGLLPDRQFRPSGPACRVCLKRGKAGFLKIFQWNSDPKRHITNRINLMISPNDIQLEKYLGMVIVNYYLNSNHLKK